MGVTDTFVQDNVSVSKKGTLRGLHRQTDPFAQAKFVTVLEGAVYDVAVDCRPDSSTYLDWVGYELSADNRRSLYIPTGFAHGFYVLSDQAIFTYKCSAKYAPDSEASLRYDDPRLAIDGHSRGPNRFFLKKDAAVDWLD